MNYESVLGGLTIPVMISHGRKDHYSLPLLADLLHRHIPNSRLCWFEQSGHMPFFQKSEQYNSTLAAFVSDSLIPPQVVTTGG